MRLGATGARLTFSFSTPDYQLEQAAELRRTASELALPFTVVADLAGEKFRLGRFTPLETVRVEAGLKLALIPGTTSDPLGQRLLTVRDPAFFAQIQEGDLVLVGDGSAMLRVVEAGAERAELEVVEDGVLDQHRGLTIQGSHFRPRCLTDKDLADLAFVAAHEEFDAVALSFVSGADDIEDARKVMAAAGRQLPVVAKIETARGVQEAEAICRAADMVMAARGDLALAVPWVELPAAILSIERAALAAGVPWLVATQIAEGLERYMLPTRAEICDLANWMSRGCGGALLSYETVFGSKPLEAIRCVRTLMDRYEAPVMSVPE